MEQEKKGIDVAIERAGSQSALAAELGVTQQAVSSWQRFGWVPIRRAVEIEALYGVPRGKLISPRIADLVDLPDESEGGEL